MSAFEKPAHKVTLTAPAGGAETDQGYVIGSIFAIASGGGVLPGASLVPAGQPFEGLVVGQVNLAKKTGETWAEGDDIHWDDATKEASNVAGTMVIGVAVSAAISAATTASVRLNGVGDPAGAAAAGRFVSTEQTGTGAPQNIAHGLGAIPTDVFVAPTDLAPATTGDYTVTEGAHDATDVIVTVTSGKKYKVLAWR